MIASSETTSPHWFALGWLGMMNKLTLLNRSGLAAIAAATAFLSTPVMAQETAPVAADPAPIVADAPLPAEPAPTPPADVVSDPLTPAEATTTTTTTRTTRTTRPTRATAAPAARIPAPVARAVSAAPVAPSAPVTAPVQEATPAFDPAMVAPLPESSATPPAPATSDSMIDNDLLPIAGAAGLGILALAGAGLAMRRRRREDDVLLEETFHEPAMARAEPMPVATAPIVATTLTAAPLAATSIVDKSAFSWSDGSRETVRSKNWIEAARRGPTPDNPSLSLKKRLQRAAFFDQRERAVASGTALPLSPMAGLPEALAKQSVTETRPVRRPVQSIGMNFGRTFQPA